MDCYIRKVGLDAQLFIVPETEDEEFPLINFARIGDHFAGHLEKTKGCDYAFIVLERIEDEPLKPSNPNCRD